MLEYAQKSIKNNWKTILIFLTIIFFIIVIGIIYCVTLPEIVLFILVAIFVFLLVSDLLRKAKMDKLIYGPTGAVRGNPRICPAFPPIVGNFDHIPNAANLVEELSYYDGGVFDKGEMYGIIVAAESIDRNFDKIPNAAKIIERWSNDKYKCVYVTDIINHYFDKIPNASKIIERLMNRKYSIYTPYKVPDVIKEHFDKIPNADKIIEMLAEDKNEYVRIGVVGVINQHFDKIPNAAKLLEKLAQDEYSGVRNDAIKIIKEKWNYPAQIYRNKFSESFINKISMESESGEIQILRDLISEKIDESKSRQISDLVERILLEYKSENKIALCRMLLENFYKFPKANEIIEKLMKDPDDAFRESVADAVSKYSENIINIQTSQKILEMFANDKYDGVRWYAVQMAAKNIDRIPNAKAIIKKLKDDPSKTVRDYVKNIWWRHMH